MDHETNEWINPGTREALDELAELTQFPGLPKEFWPRYLKALGNLSCAYQTTLFLYNRERGETEADWKKITEWKAPDKKIGPDLLRELERKIEPLTEKCSTRTASVLSLDEFVDSSTTPEVLEYSIVALQPRLYQSEEKCLTVSLVPELDPQAAAETVLRMELAGDIPESYQMNLAARRAGADVAKLATALDVSVLINAEERFIACALAFCNGLAAQLQCDRVSLGWMVRGFIRLQAISRTEKFDRHMEAAQLLEAAMDEAFDQDDEIFCPAHEEAMTVGKDHERFAKDQGAVNLVSLPLRIDEEPAGVVTCERSASPFEEHEVAQLRLACDVAARRLSDLKQRDRWFGARAAAAFKKKCGQLLGPEHTWAKLIAIILVVILALLIFLKVPYRVEANFILKSDEVSYVTAPFEGFIEEVLVRTGDSLEKGATLLTLNRTDLELQRASAQADLTRYHRESEKARAAGQLAEMRIAESLAAQSQARLDLVVHRLDQTLLTTPFDSIVVEGDQRERHGAPVAQGDVLYKLARTDSLYVEAEVPERDIHEILGRDTGQIAFVSQPKFKYPIRIDQIVPAAVPGEEGNVFLVQAQFTGELADWWKPGMSGVCKLSVEKRSLGWIFTHRTADFFRMFFWW